MSDVPEYTDEDFDRHMAPEAPWFVESWDTEQWKRDEDLGTFVERPKAFGWFQPASPDTPPLRAGFDYFVSMGDS